MSFDGDRTMDTHPRQQPDFSTFRSVEVRNVKTGERAELIRADLVEATPTRLDEITRICNEPLIYDFLFRRSLHGEPYPRQKARDFLELASRGWRENTHFVFIILSADGAPAGNVEIKSNAVEAAEIGYWATARQPGFVTPAVGAVCDIARSAGFKSLFAHTRPYNDRSMGVLRRNGFRNLGFVGTGPETARKFFRVL